MPGAAEVKMRQGGGSDRHSTVTRNLGLVVGGTLILLVWVTVFLALAFMNLTPGHFGFPDADGCACEVSYTTQPSTAACDATRPRHCDRVWLGHLLVYLSSLDFNK